MKQINYRSNVCHNLFSTRKMAAVASSFLLAPSPEASLITRGACNSNLVWQVENRQGYSTLRLYHPYDVTFIDDQYACVVEGFFPYSRIQIVDRKNGRKVQHAGQGDIMPFGVTTDSGEHILVTDHKDRTVKYYSLSGSLLHSWDTNMFGWPDGISVNKNGKVAVSDWSKGSISLHDPDGKQIYTFSTINEEKTSYSCPTYLTIDNKDRYIITDVYDKSVKVFSPGGKLLHQVGNQKNLSNIPEIKDPRGVAIDNSGNIVVADWGNNCLLLYSPEGQFVKKPLQAETGLCNPWGLDIDTNGQVLISQHKLDKKPSLKLFKCL